jgi:hypothetical protein
MQELFAALSVEALIVLMLVLSGLSDSKFSDFWLIESSFGAVSAARTVLVSENAEFSSCKGEVLYRV